MSHPTWQSIFMYVISDFHIFEALTDLPEQILKTAPENCNCFSSLFLYFALEKCLLLF
jgi:hypothetical protein